MKVLFFACILVCLIFPLTAQNYISGKVLNQSESPLAGANIFISELNKACISGAEGSFNLNNLPLGTVKLQISYVGYKTFTTSIAISEGGNDILVKLEESVIAGEEILITGGYSSTKHENAVNIDVLRLNDPSLITSPNLMQSLQKIPGIDMISKGSGISKPVIRGLSMNDILVLNNNVRFENYQYSSHHPLGLDEFGISEIEIIKGPASLLYGSDAIGGVINFIKEKPAAVGKWRGDYTSQFFSNSLGISNSLGLKGSSKNLFGGIIVGQKNNADYLQGGGQYVPNTRSDEYSVKTNAGFSGKSGTFKVYYDYSQQKLGLAEDEAIEQITKRGRKTELFYQQFNTHLLSSQNKLFLGRFKLDLNTSYQNTELIHFAEPEEYELQMKLSTLVYESKIYFPSDSKSIYILGAQGIYQTNRNLFERETILLPDAGIQNYSVFGLAQKTLFESLKFQFGGRFDRKVIDIESVGISSEANYRNPIDTKFGSFSGSTGLVYTFSDDFLVRGNIAAAFRTPNLAELSSDGQHETRYEKGDPNLVPENSAEVDISLHLHKENYTFDVSLFYNSIKNYIFISPSGDTTASGLYIYEYLQANSVLMGGEVGLHIHPKPIEWLHIETGFSNVTGKQEDGSYLPFIPANKFNAEFRAETDRIRNISRAYVSLDSHSAFRQDHPAIEETSTEAYSLVNLGVGAEFEIGKNAISLAISADNIFDKKYIDHLSTLKEVNFYNPGRNVSLRLRVNFGN